MADDVTKRVRYFDHQFLRLAEFETEQTYHLDRRRRLTQGLHSPGVVDGLDVSASDSLEVTIAPGWAIDALGREMVLTTPTTISIPPADGTAEVYLVYAEEVTDPSEDPGTEGLNTRVTERPVAAVGPPSPPGGILLASATVSGGAITGVTDRRTFAGVDADNLVDGSVTEAKLADGAVTTPKLAAAAVTRPILGPDAVGTPNIADDAVTEAQLADAAVGPAQIQDRAVGLDHLDPTVSAGLVSCYAVYDGVNGSLLNSHNVAAASRSDVGKYEFKWNLELHERGPVFVYAYAPPEVAPGLAIAFVTTLAESGIAIEVVDRDSNSMDAVVNVMAFGATGEQPLGPPPAFPASPTPIFTPNSAGPGAPVTIAGRNFVRDDTRVALVPHPHPQAGPDIPLAIDEANVTEERIPFRVPAGFPAGQYRARVSTTAGSELSPGDRRLEVTT